jgi:predicted choloylglycine hydrolase
MGGAAIWYRKKPQPGLRMNAVTRWVLDTFSDTPSAVDYLQRIPHHEGIAYPVADKTGCIARVEAAPEGVDLAMTKDGMLAAINQYQSPKVGQRQGELSRPGMGEALALMHRSARAPIRRPGSSDWLASGRSR